MRSYDENDEWNKKELEEIRAEPWMIELLKMNPSYPYWGPYEDYMWVCGEDEGPDELGRKPDGGWRSRILCKSWRDFSIDLNDLNEIVNFYFEIDRKSKNCDLCGGNGYHQDALWVSESFYEHSSPFKSQSRAEEASAMLMASFSGTLPKTPSIGRRYGNVPSEEVLAKYSPEFREFCDEMSSVFSWHDRITEDEAGALITEGRAKAGQSCEDINKQQNQGGFMGHDGINRSILIRARCERYGIPIHCPDCDGNGYVYTTEQASVNLVMWLLHPRKGASRGVEVKNILQDDLPKVFAYLREAAARNAERFSRIPQ